MTPTNRFDISLALRHFSYSDGILYRRLGDGSLREISVVETGRLVATVAGVKYVAADIVWALVYGCWPKFQVTVLGDDPKDLSIGNLVALRGQRHRLRITARGDRFTHPLSEASFGSVEAAEASWKERVESRYRKDQGMVHQIEAAERELAGDLTNYDAVTLPKRRPRKVPINPAPPKPDDIAGKAWYWFKGQWVSVPEAIHPSDDRQLRCAAVLAGARHFTYDAALGRTVQSNTASAA